jgi:hypothetical protein
MDQQVAHWAAHNLASYLPKPKASRSTVTKRRVVQPDDGQVSVMQHTMLLAQNIIQKATEPTDRENAPIKPLPDPLLYQLLGLSGLTWEDQHLLSPVCTQLH